MLVRLVIMIQLFNGDCNEILKQIPDKSVDLVLTDPPYNLTEKTEKMAGFAFGGRAGLNFGEWDKNADILTYINEVSRILNENGTFVVFNAWRNLGDIANYAEKLDLVAKDVIRLEKSNPMPRNRDRRYIVDYEFAIWFVKAGSKWTFNRQHPKYERPKYVGAIETGLHPTQKNLGLMEWLIKIHSNEGNVVLDPFMGSGTTGRAALNLNRSFIGIEQDSKYFEIAKTRLGVE